MSEVVEAEEIPAGFRLTQLGPRTITVPEHWNRVRVKDVSEVVTRGKQPTYVDEPGVPVLNQSCIYWDGYHQENLKYLDEDVAEGWKPKHFATKGDILINSTGQGTLGRALYWDKESGTHAIDSHITRVSVDSDTIDPEFLRYYLESTWGQTMLYVFCVAGSTGQIELSKTDLMSMPLLSPLVEEQRRIANILSTVDKKIQQTDEIIKETGELKRGLRQDLIVGKGLSDEYREVRLGAKTEKIPFNWEIKSFSEVASVEKGNTPKTSNSEYYGGDIVWVTPDDLSDLYERGEKYISDSKRKLTEAGLDSTSVNVVPAPSVMFTSRSYGIGKTAICTVPAGTNQGIIAFHCDDGLSEEYLYYYLNHIMNYIIELSGVSTFPEVSLTDIRNLKVPVPTKQHQERIVNILQSADKEIVEEKENKQKLQELKRGLMQDLLTGKVRVNTD